MSMIQKKFEVFNPVRKKWKMMNKLFIKGSLKGGFLKKDSNFELVIVFTGIKKVIIDIQLIDNNISLSDKRLKFDFKIGDHIDKAKDWIKENGHEIDLEQNRF